jgi:rod shape-determining protein MreD
VIRPAIIVQLDMAWRSAMPVALTLVLLFLGMLPWKIPLLGVIAASSLMISVFFWSLYRPAQMNLWCVACIGLLNDLLGLMPFGIGLLVFVLVHGIARLQRKALEGMPFILVWGVFGLVAGGATILTWLLVSLRQDTGLVDPTPAFRLYMFGLVCYPPLAFFFARIEQRLFAEA